MGGPWLAMDLGKGNKRRNLCQDKDRLSRLGRTGRQRRKEFSQERLNQLALKAGIKNPTVIYDEVNMWIVFTK